MRCSNEPHGAVSGLTFSGQMAPQGPSDPSEAPFEPDGEVVYVSLRPLATPPFHMHHVRYFICSPPTPTLKIVPGPLGIFL